MKPLVVLTQRVHADAIELLLSVCDIALVNTHSACGRNSFRDLARHAQGLLSATPERIDERLIASCHGLRVLACTYRLPEHIDIAACTRRGVWVTNVTAGWLGRQAEIEAARNILDVISGDPPRGALNDVLSNAA